MPFADLLVGIVQVVVLLFLIIYSVRTSYTNQKILTYKLIVGAFFCCLMGVCFWLPYYYIMQDYPYGVSAAVFSFIGYYCFILSANFSLKKNWTEEHTQAVKKYRLPAMAGPVITILFCLSYLFKPWQADNLITPMRIIENSMLLISISIWAYVTLLYFLATRKSSMSFFYGIVLLEILLELLIFFFSIFTGPTYFILAYIQIIGWLFIIPAAKRAVSS